MIRLTPNPSQSFFVDRIQSQKKSQKKELFRGKGEWRIEQKMKRKHYSDREGPHNVNKKAR